jgi:hypothetical protein
MWSPHPGTTVPHGVTRRLSPKQAPANSTAHSARALKMQTRRAHRHYCKAGRMLSTRDERESVGRTSSIQPPARGCLMVYMSPPPCLPGEKARARAR